jgi:predicted RNA binding protein YcfA (HicA-like mRNA interferase family)
LDILHLAAPCHNVPVTFTLYGEGDGPFGAQGAPCYPSLMKIAEVLRLLHEDGWYLVATRGSHRQFKHPTKPGRVTVPGKPSDDVALGTLNSIRKQAGLK